MCLYPRIRKNPKYTENSKNGGNIPPVRDKRVLYVPIGCGDCMECRKKKAREWQVRLLEDIKTNKNGKMITLTFSNESIKELIEMKPTKNWPGMKHLTGYELDNEIATRAVRLFNERWRKKHKKALRHWLVTELGHKNTENIHLHGIIWTDESLDEIRDTWQYGFIWPKKEYKGKYYVNAETANYIIKYVNKKDLQHKEYRSIILTSPGIGKNYTNTHNSKLNKFNEADTDETYRSSTGHHIAMPIYWRNKIYTDEEREALWLHKLDKNERWVMGEKIDISVTEEEYYKTIQWYRRINAELGYGTGQKNWNRAEYEQERRHLKQQERITAAKQKT